MKAGLKKPEKKKGRIILILWEFVGIYCQFRYFNYGSSQFQIL